jgi:hypothetical protein
VSAVHARSVMPTCVPCLPAFLPACLQGAHEGTGMGAFPAGSLGPGPGPAMNVAAAAAQAPIGSHAEYILEQKQFLAQLRLSIPARERASGTFICCALR